MFRTALSASAFLLGVSAAAFAQPTPNTDKATEGRTSNGSDSQLSLSKAQQVHTGNETGPHKMSQGRGPQNPSDATVKPTLQSTTPGAPVAAGR
jgi:hypothetical protein